LLFSLDGVSFSARLDAVVFRLESS